MIVKLRRRNARYRDLTPGQPYVVIGIEGDHLRILNDAGRPYLYSPGLFVFIYRCCIHYALHGDGAGWGNRYEPLS